MISSAGRFGGPPQNNPMFGGGQMNTNNATMKIESVTVEDLLCEPGRKTRPAHIVVIVRGLPGSGKSHIAKSIKVC